jgi:glycosyltransferase involved in cell wall biosynthesis
MEARALVGAGHDVTVICPAGATRDVERRTTIDGVEIWRYPYREAGAHPWSYLVEYGSALRHMRKLARGLAREKPFDIVQLCNPPDVLYLAIASLRRHGTRVIFDHHDLVPELYEARFGQRGGLLRRAATLAERRTFRAAHVVLSPNESYRHIAIDRGRKRPEDVFVVRMAPDPERFRSMGIDPELKRGKPFLIAYAGTIGPQDGVDQALRALRLLADRRGDWHAVFAGTGDALPGMLALCRELGLGERVEFPGYLGDEALVRLLGSADVCLSPEPPNALNEASTMIKVVEYMGLGRPIVAYDLRETRYSAGDGALYAAPGDVGSLTSCIERLLDDPALRVRLGAAGLQRVEELSWARSEASLLAAYQHVLALNPPERRVGLFRFPT